MSSAVVSALLASLVGAVGIFFAAVQLRRGRSAPAAEPPAPPPVSAPAPPPVSPTFPQQPWGPQAAYTQRPASSRPRSRVPLFAGIVVAVLLTVTLGLVVVIGLSGGDNDPKINPTVTATQSPSPTPTSGPTAEPAVTVTVTALVPAQSRAEDDDDKAAWIAALGAVLAGLGTVASSIAAFVRYPARRESD